MLSAVAIGRSALQLTVLCGYFYFFTEWLFFVTKPSVLSLLPPLERVAVLLTAPIPLLAVASGATLIAALPLALLLRARFDKGPLAAVVLGLAPAAILAATVILLVENFTYTMFRFGIISLEGWTRHLYLAPIAFVAGLCLRTTARWLAATSWLARPGATAATALLLAASGIATAFQLQSDSELDIGIEAPVGDAARRYPNVLIFSSDGINARRMSAYGYARPTTPFIDTLAERSLVFENHFSNSAKTTGSVGSLLSGKLPTTTRVVFRPDIFTGVHVYQHLPGLLRRHGFHNGDFSVRHYIDAYDLNMRDAFHWANGRSLEEEGMLLPKWFRRSLPSAALFAEASYDRISGRLLHVLGVREMQNPYLAVARPDPQRASDRERMDALKQFIRDSPEPFFAHVHLLGTHGPFFPVSEQRFSAGQQQDRAWMPDFYDDAILQYDRFTREIVEFLQERGSFESTILVLNTDHGFRWAIDEPLPLIIHLPEERHTGVRIANSQRLDIGPTLLDYLGISQPEWMAGRSLLSLRPGRLRPIIVTNRRPSVEIGGWRQVASPSPPFYTLGSVNAILCNFIYHLDLRTGRSLRQQIPHHTAPCLPRQLPRDPEVRAFLVDHLKSSGYDVSGLSR